MSEKVQINKNGLTNKLNIYINDEEQALYEASRALKFKAREKRKLRVERERKGKEAVAVAAAKIKEQSLKEDAKYKEDLDNRIRKAMFEFAATVKKYQLAFEAPLWDGYSWGGDTEYKDVFKLHDTYRGDPARSGKLVQIRTMHNGFNWK
jgi:hypothetical protein